MQVMYHKIDHLCSVLKFVFTFKSSMIKIQTWRFYYGIKKKINHHLVKECDIKDKKVINTWNTFFPKIMRSHFGDV